MNIKELYNDVIKTLNEDEGSFNAAVRNWMSIADYNPFEDPETRELFAKAKACYLTWKSNAISSRVSKRRMIAYVRQIAEKGLPNPYKDIPEPETAPENNEETQEKEAEKLKEEAVVENPTERSAEQNETEIEQEKPEVQHILGVIPEPPSEEKPHLFNRRKKR